MGGIKELIMAIDFLKIIDGKITKEEVISCQFGVFPSTLKNSLSDSLGVVIGWAYGGGIIKPKEYQQKDIYMHEAMHIAEQQIMKKYLFIK